MSDGTSAPTGRPIMPERFTSTSAPIVTVTNRTHAHQTVERDTQIWGVWFTYRYCYICGQVLDGWAKS